MLRGIKIAAAVGQPQPSLLDGARRFGGGFSGEIGHHQCLCFFRRGDQQIHFGRHKAAAGVGRRALAYHLIGRQSGKMHYRQCAHLQPSAADIDFAGPATLPDYIRHRRAGGAQAYRHPHSPSPTHFGSGGGRLRNHAAFRNALAVEAVAGFQQQAQVGERALCLGQRQAHQIGRAHLTAVNGEAHGGESRHQRNQHQHQDQ